jgi:hypothetical protein
MLFQKGAYIFPEYKGKPIPCPVCSEEFSLADCISVGYTRTNEQGTFQLIQRLFCSTCVFQTLMAEQYKEEWIHAS